MKKKNNKNELVTKEHLDKKFEEFGKIMDSKFETFARMVQKGFEQCATKVGLEEVKSDVKEIKATMVTKPFLEDKLSDLEGSVILRQRKEDKRFKMLVEFLSKKKVLSKTELNMLQEIQVFPSIKIA